MQKRNRWLIRALQLVVVATVFGYVLKEIDWGAVRDVDIDWRWIAGACLIQLLYIAIYASLWHLLTIVHQIQIPYRKAISLWSFSLVGKYIPTRIAMVVYRVAGYRRWRDASYEILLLCCYLEWILAVLAGVFVGGMLGLLDRSVTIVPHFRSIIFLALIVLLPMVWPRFLSGILNFVLGLLKRSRMVIPITFKQVLVLLSGYCMAWFVLGITLYFVLRSLGYFPTERIIDCSFTYAIAGILGIAAILMPSGLGVRDGAMIVLLSGWLNVETALVATVLARIVATVSEFLAVLIAWLMDRDCQGCQTQSGRAFHDAE